MKKKKGSPKFLLNLILISTILLPVMAVAQDQNKVNIQPLTYAEEANVEDTGRLKVIPTLALQFKYDDNFYKAENDEHGVFTYILRPGIRLGWGSAKTNMELMYNFGATWYSDQGDTPEGYQDASDGDYVEQNLEFSIWNRSLAKLSIGLDESFRYTRDPGSTDRFDNDTSRRKYYINRLTPMINYRYNERFSSHVGYRNTIIEYKEGPPVNDSVEHRGLFDLRYYFSPTASIAADYNIWQQNYDVSDGDYTSNMIGAILRKEAKFWYVEAGAGYEFRSFDAEDRDNQSAPTFRIAFNTQTSGLDEGIPKTYAKLALDKRFSDAGNRGDFSDNLQISFEVGHLFIEKIRTSATGYYRRSEYEDFLSIDSTLGEDREDDRYGISGTVDYYFTDWLLARATLGYESNDSNLAGYDYNNTFVYLSLDAAYDIGKRLNR
jgi:hypothetical protein